MTVRCSCIRSHLFRWHTPPVCHQSQIAERAIPTEEATPKLAQSLELLTAKVTGTLRVSRHDLVSLFQVPSCKTRGSADIC